MASTLSEIPDWTFKADYVETCNCDYGCPCNLMGFLQMAFAVPWFYFTFVPVVMGM